MRAALLPTTLAAQPLLAEARRACSPEVSALARRLKVGMADAFTLPLATLDGLRRRRPQRQPARRLRRRTGAGSTVQRLTSAAQRPLARLQRVQPRWQRLDLGFEVQRGARGRGALFALGAAARPFAFECGGVDAQ